MPLVISPLSPDSPFIAPFGSTLDNNSPFGTYYNNNNYNNNSNILTNTYYDNRGPLTTYYDTNPPANTYYDNVGTLYNQRDAPLVVVSDEMPNSPFPYLTSFNTTYTKPAIGFFENLNADPRVHKRMVKYFYYKALDKWMYEDMRDVLNYFTIKNDKVDLISSMKDYDVTAADKESNETTEKKIDFIGKYILTQSYMNKILNDFVNRNNISWVDLPKRELLLEQVVEEKLTKMLRGLIADKGK